MITYKHGSNHVEVMLDGKKVGAIKPVIDGWQYFPKGSKSGGDVLPTIRAVKATLEAK